MKIYTFLISLAVLFLGIAPSLGQMMNFSKDSVIAVGGVPMIITYGDFNADNSIDLAVGVDNESIFDPTAIFLNDGMGQLNTTADSMYQNTNGARGMAAGDLNNDQIVDLAISIEDDSVIVILLGNGDGTFTQGSDVAVPTQPGGLVIADFDNDTNNDLMVASRYSLMVTYMGSGDGTFAEPVTKGASSSVRDIEAHDMNGDGYIDILLGSGNVRSVGLFLNDGSGNFDTRTNLYLMRTPWHLDVGDFNKDTYPDVVAGSGSYDFDNVFLLLGDMEGNYSCPDTLSPGTYVGDVSVGDYNGDSNLDLLIADRNGLYIMTGSGDGHFSQTDTIDYKPGAYQVKNVKSIDMNNDGRLDLVIARDQQISVYYNKATFNSLSDVTMTPASFQLDQNYPNPFNPITMINYQLTMTNYIELNIYNVLGQKVATLVSKRQGPGQYQIAWDASGFSSGIYFYRLKTENGTKIKKMQLIK